MIEVEFVGKKLDTEYTKLKKFVEIKDIYVFEIVRVKVLNFNVIFFNISFFS